MEKLFEENDAQWVDKIGSRDQLKFERIENETHGSLHDSSVVEEHTNQASISSAGSKSNKSAKCECNNANGCCQCQHLEHSPGRHKHSVKDTASDCLLHQMPTGNEVLEYFNLF